MVLHPLLPEVLSVLTVKLRVFVNAIPPAYGLEPVIHSNWKCRILLPNELKNAKFLPRDALLCRARSCDYMSSVRLSACLTVCNVGASVGSWKLIARTISPTSSLCVAQRSSAYSQGNMGKFWGRLEVGWKKVACWSTKAAISLKRV